jgi:2-amino-4-hydroxy-6-hydroxymethyldihydropteridine diphosphokinase
VVYLGVGSNLGDRQAYIKQALALIADRAGTVCLVSDYFESPSWGYVSPNNYINVAVGIETSLQPMELLAVTQEIERNMGRLDKTINGEYRDRVIDIDILLFEDRIISTTDLTIPHPQLHNRVFVLVPMNEIAPYLIHPVLKQTMAAIYSTKVAHPIIN